ncbi:ABC transporter ATP-binding protein [Candidatus Borkfalkia ceftriaxoniphila]|uniref:ABC transporter ATP-binding protein n=1 Tax=Candidatus Borkfalkia ceftriaxoniphila TaxID=2508949 RepID=A0A4V1QUR3_9FIRM|nr:ABC transporter ATP-binding protein [Candidatus Borkfalkia ceftriaxoniphila]RXZ58330.1 ABC transporter ATP-binding protein [Candidatus Borkfalkia ceftriaxoniphila]
MQEILKVENVRKTFRLSRRQQKIERAESEWKVALDGLSFSAYEGEIFGLLGPNGAGKTTMLRILSTLIKADEGEAYVNGANVKSEPDKVRASLGFMTGELKLEEFFTPNYLFGFFGKLYGMSEEKIAARRRELFEKFGIDKFAEVKVGELSTGMKQKVSLVISIIHDPAIIVFDEPTNGLDVLTAKVVTDFLLELKAQGKSVILSTHIFSLVEKLCDRVGVVIEGKMAACGTLEDLCGGRPLEEVFFEIYERTVGTYDA